MLGRDDQRGGAHRLAAFILQRHLALGVGLEEIDDLVVAVVRHLLEDAVRVIERRRHQVGRLVGRVAEHDALVAGAFVLVAALVDALGDVRGLAVQVILEAGGLPVEAVLLVADALHGGADGMPRCARGLRR